MEPLESNHAVLIDVGLTQLCIDDGYTVVTQSGEILNANAKSTNFDDIVEYVQSLPTFSGKTLKITPVPLDRIEGLLEILTQANTVTDTENETLLGLRLTALCQQSVNDGASDIHIEVHRNQTRYLLRIDGLREIMTQFANGQSATRQGRESGVDLASYVFSTLGKQDINEREPANDSFEVTLIWEGVQKTFEYRAALMPLDRGIKLTLRCLTPRDKPLLLDDMDLPTPYKTELLRSMNQRSGAIVICGPMGSGKSSLIYAMNDTVDSTARCIHALEDPVEFDQKGICKTAVEPNTETKVGSGIFKDYAFYAKEQLRHDIDVSVFGELRGHLTAKEYSWKATTGGLAIATLHTNSAQGVPQTFIEHMGISPAVVASPDFLRTIIHLKLIRKLCPLCAVPYDKAVQQDSMKEKAEHLKSLLPDDYQSTYLKSHTGCDKCRNKGEKGRVVVMELIVLDDDDRRYIATQDYLGWKEALHKKGWPDIRDHALSRIRDGLVDIASASEQINDLLPMAAADIYTGMRAAL